MNGLAWAVLAAAATAAPDTDRLVQAPTPDLVVGFTQDTGTQSIEERVPKGETVEDWSRMVTTQWAKGAVANGVGPAVFAERMASGWTQSCAGGTVSPVRTISIGGRSGVEARFDCPLNTQTGKPETMFLRVIAGAADLHMVQVAFRHVPAATDVAWAQKHLASVAVCGAGDRAGLCGG